jgi:hypothetical protein
VLIKFFSFNEIHPPTPRYQRRATHTLTPSSCARVRQPPSKNVELRHHLPLQLPRRWFTGSLAKDFSLNHWSRQLITLATRFRSSIFVTRFRSSISRLNFAHPFRDSILLIHFATQFRSSISRHNFARQVHQSRDSISFTNLATRFRPSILPINFATRFPSSSLRLDFAHQFRVSISLNNFALDPAHQFGDSISIINFATRFP